MGGDGAATATNTSALKIRRAMAGESTILTSTSGKAHGDALCPGRPSWWTRQYPRAMGIKPWPTLTLDMEGGPDDGLRIIVAAGQGPQPPEERMVG